MKKILISILVALAALSAQSCLFEQADIFDGSSSKRLSDAMDASQKALVNSQYGWLFEMYPEGSQTYGGYAFICQFSADKTVTVYTELASDVSKPCTSYYKMTNDNGPVLIFDTYNDYIHYLSTPSSSAYQAFQGEFEFVVTDIKDDVISLRGSKTGNKMYLRKMTMPAVDYLKILPSIEERIIFSGFTGTVNGVSVTAEVDIDNRQTSFVVGEESATVRAYAITPEGFRLYKPIKVGEVELSAFAVSEDGSKVTVADGSAKGTEFKSVYPEGYRMYDDYAGDYIFKYNAGEFPVTLVPAGDGVNYKMEGVNDNYDWVLQYSKAKGNLSLLCQMLYDKKGAYAMYDGKYLALTPCSPSNATGTSGYLSYSSTVGMMTKWNLDEANPVYTFVDNGMYSGHAVNTFWFCLYTGPTQTSSTRTSGNKAPKELQPFGQSQIIFKVTSLTKVK